jgi:hypothetical protein
MDNVEWTLRHEQAETDRDVAESSTVEIQPPYYVCADTKHPGWMLEMAKLPGQPGSMG